MQDEMWRRRYRRRSETCHLALGSTCHGVMPPLGAAVDVPRRHAALGDRHGVLAQAHRIEAVIFGEDWDVELLVAVRIFLGWGLARMGVCSLLWPPPVRRCGASRDDASCLFAAAGKGPQLEPQ